MESRGSNQEWPSKSLQIPEAKQPTKAASTNNTMSPICRLSPNYKGSALYDSYELQAVVQQLNKAIQGSKGFSPISLRSPLYRKHLKHISGDNKSPKRLTCSAFSSAPSLDDDKIRKGVAWVTRLWMRVKQGFLRNKHKE